MKILEKIETKIIQETKNKEIVDIDGHLYIRQKNPSVIIMPYTLNKKNKPEKIGIINEILKQRPNGIYKTLITGTPRDDDENIFQTAIRELREESGYEVENIERWKFLGSIYTSKLILNSNPCFAVNVTSLTPLERKPDKGDKERDSKFELIDIEEALSIDDCLVNTLFIKTFKYLF